MAVSPSSLAARPDPFSLAADLLDAPPLESRWYCDQLDCDGEPHKGFHWCEHPVDSAEHTWECRHARADQRPPVTFADGSARGWMLMAGRGFGKTRSAAEWLADQARRNARSYWAVIAPTYDDVQSTCFEGESGLLPALGIDPEDRAYNKSKLRVRLPNGAIIRSYSAEKPERVRGPNLWGVWLEEPATWPGTTMWDNVFPAVRRGLAQYVISSTPKPVPMITQFTSRDDGSVVITKGSTFDNEHNLAAFAVAELKTRWLGTRKEQQELYGKLLEDVPGALWTASVIESGRAVLID